MRLIYARLKYHIYTSLIEYFKAKLIPWPSSVAHIFRVTSGLCINPDPNLNQRCGFGASHSKNNLTPGYVARLWNALSATKWCSGHGERRNLGYSSGFIHHPWHQILHIQLFYTPFQFTFSQEVATGKRSWKRLSSKARNLAYSYFIHKIKLSELM